VNASLPDNSDKPDTEGDSARVSRRDFARLGVFAGGVALTAPSIRTIRFAGKVVGSVHTPPTTPITEQGAVVSPEPTSSTVAGSTTTTTAAQSPAGETNSGTLPFTGAAIGGLAVVGGAAVGVGRAMSSAKKRRGTDEDQDFIDDAEDV
jgi:hypothetical protein